MALRLVVAMDRGEREDFLATDEWKALSDIAGELSVFDTEDADSEALHAALAGLRPEVLITCWSTPPLLDGRAESVLAHLRNLCHITGSVRGPVPHTYI